MSDTSITWGGGPNGYLPLNYQPQSREYYSGPGVYGPAQQTANGRWYSPMVQRAPWEDAYARDTWTQNYDPSKPGYDPGTRQG